MTQEQKQNAEAYILKEYPKVPTLTKCAIAGIFAAGAHSRDEEVEKFERLISKIRDMVNESIDSHSFSYQQHTLDDIQNLLKED